MKLRLLLALALPLASACVQTGPMAGGGPRPYPAFSDTVTDRLYFGRDIPGGGGMVTDSAWGAFLREVVTPRFPNGLTIYRAEGQWREDDGRIVSEPSFVLEVVHAANPTVDARLGEIAEDYKRRFRQEAVMRITSPARPRFYE